MFTVYLEIYRKARLCTSVREDSGNSKLLRHILALCIKSVMYSLRENVQ